MNVQALYHPAAFSLPGPACSLGHVLPKLELTFHRSDDVGVLEGGLCTKAGKPLHLHGEQSCDARCTIPFPGIQNAACFNLMMLLHKLLLLLLAQ